MRQNYKSTFGLLFALLFLISSLVPFLPQNGFASMLFEEDPTQGSTGEASTSNIEICDNIVDDDGDGLIDNQDVVDCPTTAGPILTPTPEAEEEEATDEEPTPTPTPEAEEEEATDEELADEESETEICDNTIDDDGDGLVDTEDNEDCPAPEDEEATDEEPTPTPTPEAEEEEATDEEPTPTPTPEAEEEEATDEELADEE
ncbi:MAG: hypothetical protein ACRD42_04850, partial [Nitrososphaeraceae archaeon]